MIVDNFDVLHAGRAPTKADTILFVHPDAVLAFPATFERLEPIARWDPKVAKTAGDLKLTQLSSRGRLDAPETPNSFAGGEGFSIRTAERQNHRAHNNAKR